MIGQKTATIGFGEEAVEAPHAVLLGPDVQQVDHQQIARLCALDPDRA
jgi:hypothetical protein